MARIETKITNLKERPDLFKATINLIESSFHYTPSHSFEEDFSPLIDESNHHNCFILIDNEEKVLAHIGAKSGNFEINKQTFPVTMLGGIAVDESRRGEGHFQTLLNDVIAEKRSDCAFFLLWSDLEKLYNKFGFHLCGSQYEVEFPRRKSSFIATKYKELSSIEQKQIKELYSRSFASQYLTLLREDKDWELVSKVSSADLYIKKVKDNITDYYFINKGQDLPEIIYEYGSTGSLKSLIEEISAYGKVWMGTDLVSTELVQFQFFMSPGDLRLFSDFIASYTNGKFKIRNINIMKQEVYFDFNEETLMLELSEFLKGVFGPGQFEELELRPLFISGLDSI